MLLQLIKSSLEAESGKYYLTEQLPCKYLEEYTENSIYSYFTLAYTSMSLTISGVL